MQYCAIEDFFLNFLKNSKNWKPSPQFFKPPWSKSPITQTQFFLCSMEPCSTISERYIYLNTSYCLETRKMPVFCPFWPLTPTYFGQLTPNLIPNFPLWYGTLWYNVREIHTCTQVTVWKQENACLLPLIPKM